jgi:dephospho-CoA kinase
MIKIALTGSIGMGKSAVARMFGARGIPVFDADAEVRRLQSPGGALVDEIGVRFPGTVKDGVLDREKLAAIVLDEPEQLRLLENIVHPAVVDARRRFIDRHRDSPALIFEIPLLFETGGEKEFDKIITVSAPADVQRARVMERPGMSEEKFTAILAQQIPDEQKRRRADFIVDTGGDLSTTERQVGEIIACLGLAPGE